MSRLVASYCAAAAEIGGIARHDWATGLAQYGLGVFDFFYRSASNVVLRKKVGFKKKRNKNGFSLGLNKYVKRIVRVEKVAGWVRLR